MADINEVQIVHNSEEYYLVFNKTILLLSKNDTLLITLKEVNNWQLEFIFEDDIFEPQYSIKHEIVGSKISFKLNKWYSSTWVETKEPIFFPSKDGSINIYIQFRSAGSEKNSQRLFYISVWKKK